MHNLPSTLDDRVQSLATCSYFQNLNDQVLWYLAERLNLRSYSGGEIVFWQDEVCAGLYILKSGSIKLFKLSTKGRELIVRVLRDHETFNEVPCFDHGLNVVNAAAMETSQVWMLEAGVIGQALSEYPEMASAVILSLAVNLRMLINKVEELSFYQVTNRLARLLIQMIEDQPPEMEALEITQSLLAARLGTVREVVARSLKELEQSGAIDVRRRKIRVVNWEIMKRWAESS